MLASLLRGLVRGANRRQLNAKIGPQGYVKGHGVRPTGRHTKFGNYVIDPNKIVQFVVPDLTNFHLKPYVSHKTPKRQVKPVTAADFLKTTQGDNVNNTSAASGAAAAAAAAAAASA